MSDIAYQLYCSRNWPLDDTLGMLAQVGYKNVEGYGGLITSVGASTLREKLDAHGLTMISCHLGLADCEADPAQAVADAKTLGLSKVFIPHIGPDDRPTDIAGWHAFGKRLADLGGHFEAAGMAFGWHNHDFECVAIEDQFPLDIIAEYVDIELDLGWVGRAGYVPADWIAKYGAKVKAVHVKDIAGVGDCADEDGWADVGHGTMDWAAITAALTSASVTHFVIEHDNPNDHARFAQRSLATVQTF